MGLKPRNKSVLLWPLDPLPGRAGCGARLFPPGAARPAQSLSSQGRGPAPLPLLFSLPALDSLWSGEPEHMAPAQPFGVGPRAGCSHQGEPGSPCGRGGPAEEKNLLLNNNAFVCMRVCTECFLKLPLSFPGTPEEGQQQRAWLLSSPGNTPGAAVPTGTGRDGHLLSPSRKCLSLFMQSMA